ncbi:hypothetical protein [Oceanicoccus sagamiensis]|uniref:Uncharacterized protein n=1 Tax=Oceanicoccus sagamiensis TaxID=716816 RepID=A0A1X9NC61_9GAMM|nr:hypothetical protein [Oceanicoccus sagamiensis]ARN74022.1 hypothetical protein BST96_07760 [Oceanicoccus sagamiensis]
MASSLFKLSWLIAIALILLSLFAFLSYSKSGEVRNTLSGQIKKCEVLRGSSTEPLSHATIEDQTGNYIIASVADCKAGADVTIFIQRGALYFNTVFAAERL